MVIRREFLKAGVLLGGTALLPGCVSSRLNSTTPALFDWATHPPGQVGMSKEGLAGIRAAIQKHIDANELTGAVSLVARNNKIAWFEAQGLRNVEAGEPMRQNDIFRLASSTKPITAAAVMMMKDAGKLSVDDKVSRFLPLFRNPTVAQLPPELEQQRFDFAKRDKLKAQVKLVPADRELTIKDLLTHTGGLSTFFGMGSGAPEIDKAKTLADRIPLVGRASLDFQPGTQWAYSPLDGFDVLAHIVEITSGMAIDEFLKTRLFDPLGMLDTGFHLSAEQRQRFVPMYRREANAWKPGFDILGAGDVTMKYLSGAGGLVGTARDYMLFQSMLLNHGTLNGRRFLSRESVAMMSTNHVGNLFEHFPVGGRKGWGFGLGVGVVVDPAAAGSSRGRGSFGWDGAHGTDGWVDPQRNLAAVYFVQQPVKPALKDFEDAIANAIVT